MTSPWITSLYASILGLLMIGLAVRVIRQRRRARVPIGDGGDKELRKRIRVHGNAIENIPILVILLFLFEANGGPSWLVHGFGVVCVLARLAHAFGYSRTSGPSLGRTCGVGGSWVTLILLALGNIWLFATA